MCAPITGVHELEHFRSYLQELEKSPATVSKYLRDVDAFQRFADGRPIDRPLVLEFKRHLSGIYAPASTNSMLAALNCYLKWAGYHHCTVHYLRRQQQSFRSSEKILSHDEYFRLLHAANSCGKQRLCFLLQTLCATGIRISELEFITTQALEQGRAQVSLKGKTRQILLPQSLCVQLQQYCRQRHIESGSIFVTRSGKPIDRSNIFHEMKALCSIAGVDERKVFPHNLRHLFACEFYDSHHDICRLADILGHSSLNTTRLYTMLSGEEQRRQLDSLGLVMLAEN